MIDKEISGIYFLVRNGIIVYVGQSCNVFRRIPEHTDKKFDEWFYIKTDKDELERLERMFIAQINPEYNVVKPPIVRKPTIKPLSQRAPRTNSDNSPFASIKKCSQITGLSMFYIRKGIKEKTIPFIQSGTKYLVNVPQLMEKLNCSIT